MNAEGEYLMLTDVWVSADMAGLRSIYHGEENNVNVNKQRGKFEAFFIAPSRPRRAQPTRLF